MKKWYQSKTIWLAIITALIGILTAFGTAYPEAGWLLTTIGVLNAMLRLGTNSEIK